MINPLWSSDGSVVLLHLPTLPVAQLCNGNDYKLSIHNGDNDDDENNNEASLEGQHSGRDRTEAPYIFANVNHDYGAWKGRFSKVLQGITRYYKVLQGITIPIKMMMMIS